MNIKCDLRLDAIGYYIVFEIADSYTGGIFSLDIQGFLPHDYLKKFEYISGVGELW